MDAGALLEGLNADQRESVTCTAAPLCIIAGAGSGKTRVLTRRIAHRVATGDAEPHRVLALTFTRKAAGELRSRLAGMGLRDAIAAGTFHGIALAQLRTRWIERGEREPQILDRKYALVARQLPRRAGHRDVNPLDAVSEIEWAKARNIGPAHYADEAAAVQPPSPAAAGRHGRRLRALRGGEEPAGVRRLRRPASACANGRWPRDPELRRHAALALPAPVRRRVPGRQPAAVRPAARLAGRPRPTCAWWATPTRPSTRGTAPTPAT